MTIPSFWNELLCSLGLPPENILFFSHLLSCTWRQLLVLRDWSCQPDSSSQRFRRCFLSLSMLTQVLECFEENMQDFELHSFLTRGSVQHSIPCTALERYCGRMDHLEFFKYWIRCALSVQIAMEQLRGEENTEPYHPWGCYTGFYLKLTLSVGWVDVDVRNPYTPRKKLLGLWTSKIAKYCFK